MSNLKNTEEIPVIVNDDGVIVRAADARDLATVSDDGNISYKNPAYAKGRYKEAIEKAAAEYLRREPAAEVVDDGGDEVEEGDARVSSEAPPRDPKHGVFSAAWLNYDCETASDEDFAKKYTHCAENMLDWLSMRPELFANIEKLEKRLGKLIER